MASPRRHSPLFAAVPPSKEWYRRSKRSVTASWTSAPLPDPTQTLLGKWRSYRLTSPIGELLLCCVVQKLTMTAVHILNWHNIWRTTRPWKACEVIFDPRNRLKCRCTDGDLHAPYSTCSSTKGNRNIKLGCFCSYCCIDTCRIAVYWIQKDGEGGAQGLALSGTGLVTPTLTASERVERHREGAAWFRVVQIHFAMLRCCRRFYGKLLQSLMDCDEDTVDRVRTSMVSRLGPEMTMLIQLLQNKPCPSTAAAAAAAIPTGVEGRGSWRWSMGPHMYKIQPNLRNRDSASNFGKKRSSGDSS